MEGKIALGASSPENPALTTPDPLSTTQAGVSSLMEKNKLLKISFAF
jgi:hypothetical protein